MFEIKLDDFMSVIDLGFTVREVVVYILLKGI